MRERNTLLASRCLARTRKRKSVEKNSARGTVKLRLQHNKPNALREELAKDRAETRVSESNDFRHDQRLE